jgi:hypothetical protein
MNLEIKVSKDLLKEVGMYLGAPPYDGAGNIVRNDERFAADLRAHYGEPAFSVACDIVRKSMDNSCADRVSRLESVISRTAKAWMALSGPPIAWCGDSADAMAAGVAEIKRLRAEIAERENENRCLRHEIERLHLERENTPAITLRARVGDISHETDIFLTDALIEVVKDASSVSQRELRDWQHALTSVIWAEACCMLDRGIDPRNEDIPAMAERCIQSAAKMIAESSAS